MNKKSKIRFKTEKFLKLKCQNRGPSVKGHQSTGHCPNFNVITSISLQIMR